MALEQSDPQGVLPLTSVSPKTDPFYLKWTSLLQVRAFGREHLLNLISDPGKVFSVAHLPYYPLVSINTSLISNQADKEQFEMGFSNVLQGEGQSK